MHSPTNEYEYIPWGYGHYLKSDEYDEFEYDKDIISTKWPHKKSSYNWYDDIYYQ